MKIFTWSGIRFKMRHYKNMGEYYTESTQIFPYWLMIALAIGFFIYACMIYAMCTSTPAPCPCA